VKWRERDGWSRSGDVVGQCSDGAAAGLCHSDPAGRTPARQRVAPAARRALQPHHVAAGVQHQQRGRRRRAHAHRSEVLAAALRKAGHHGVLRAVAGGLGCFWQRCRAAAENQSMATAAHETTDGGSRGSGHSQTRAEQQLRYLRPRMRADRNDTATRRPRMWGDQAAAATECRDHGHDALI